MILNRFKNFGVQYGVGLFFLAAAFGGILLVSCQAKPIPSSAQAPTNPVSILSSITSPGSIAFTGFVMNGNSQFSFAAAATFSAGTTIFFTNYSYDATTNTLVDESTSAGSFSYWPDSSTGQLYAWEANMATTITEGTVAYVVGAGGLTPYQSVVISNTSNAQNQLQGGAVYNVAGSGGSAYLVMNHNGAGHKILAWVGSPITVGQTISAGSTFIAAVIFGPDTWTTSGSIPNGNFWDSYLPSNLGLQSSTDLSNLWHNGQDGDLGNDNNSSDQNDNAVLNTCEGNIYGMVNPLNWQVDGNQSKKNVALAGTGLSVCTGSGQAGYSGLIQ